MSLAPNRTTPAALAAAKLYLNLSCRLSHLLTLTRRSPHSLPHTPPQTSRSPTLYLFPTLQPLPLPFPRHHINNSSFAPCSFIPNSNSPTASSPQPQQLPQESASAASAPPPAPEPRPSGPSGPSAAAASFPMSSKTAAAAAVNAPRSTLSASTDLDTPLPPSSCLDDSLAARKQKVVASLNVKGNMTTFPVVVSQGEDHGFRWVVAETQGRRKDMEDAHVVNLDIDGNGTALFAVFDGHSGKEVSSFCAQHIVEEVLASSAFARGDLPVALSEGFLALDRRMQDEDSRGELAEYAESDDTSGTKDSRAARHRHRKYGLMDEKGRYAGPIAGSTAAVALVRGDQLVVAHAGDSRVVLSEDGVARALTQDHKPDIPGERDRIYRAGQFVWQRPGGVPRVGGSLAMSRAMGDVKYKDPDLAPDQQAVTALPDVAAVRLAGGAPGNASAASSGEHPRLLVVACDGLWDVMSRQMVVNYLETQLATNGVNLRGAVSGLLHEALRHDSSTPVTWDNVTVLVVQMVAGQEAEQERVDKMGTP